MDDKFIGGNPQRDRPKVRATHMLDLLERLTGLRRDSIKVEFSRDKNSLKNYDDVVSYIKRYFNK